MLIIRTFANHLLGRMKNFFLVSRLDSQAASQESKRNTKNSSCPLLSEVHGQAAIVRQSAHWLELFNLARSPLDQDGNLFKEGDTLDRDVPSICFISRLNEPQQDQQVVH